MKDLILGANVWFARLGSTVNSAAVVPTVLPVFSTTKADWTKLGSVEQWEPRREQNLVKRRAAPAGFGKYQTRKIFQLGSTLTHAFGLQEFRRLEFELLLNAASVHVSTGAYVPNSRGTQMEGWMHVENYDQEDVKILEEDAWVSLSIDSFQFGENLNPHTVMAEVLFNSLNAGVITNLT
jgi:hypothetical protein